MLNTAQDVNTPALDARVLIAETLERNPDFDFVSGWRQPSARLEHIVGIEINRSVEGVDVPESSARCGSTARTPRELCAPRPVLLHAQWIDAKEERELSTVVGVEEDLHVVLACDVVAVRACGADDVSMQLCCANPEMDRFGRVPH